MHPRTTAWLLLTLVLVGCGRKPPYQDKSIAELERMGLRPPDIQYFMRRFKQTVAPDADERVLTVEDAARAVEKWLRASLGADPFASLDVNPFARPKEAARCGTSR